MAKTLRLIDCLSRFPTRTAIRLVGAEPTVRKDLPEIVERVRRSGHRVELISNGLRLANLSYVRTLRRAGLRHAYISMNGADNDEWYEAMDGMRCAEKKTAALRNAIAERMLVNTGTILAPGVNDGVVARMRDLVEALRPRHAVLRFKNIGSIGRYMDRDGPALTMTGLIDLVAGQLDIPRERIDVARSVMGHAEDGSRLFSLYPNQSPGNGIWVKLTDWGTQDHAGITVGRARRGRVTQDFRVAPFFDHVLQNDGGYSK